MKRNTPRHAFHYTPFRHLFFARTLTVLGNSVAPVALAFAVLDMGGSAADLGVVVAARSLFNVLFLLFGGVLADRYSRNRVLLLSSLVAALSQSGVAWLVLEQAATLTALAMLSAVNGAAAGVALPASSALVPQTVPAQRLRQANAFIQSGVYAGTIIGASLGGILTSTLGAGWGLAVDGWASRRARRSITRCAAARRRRPLPRRSGRICATAGENSPPAVGSGRWWRSLPWLTPPSPGW